MMRPTTIIAIVILLGSVFGLFQVKYRVQLLHKDLAEINRQIEEERSALHVLKAEWAYLNQADRLKTLTEKYLHLGAITVSQLYDQVNPPAVAPAVLVATATPSQPAKLVSLEPKKPVKTEKIKVATVEKPLFKSRKVAHKEHKVIMARNMPSLYPAMEPILSSLTIEQ